MPRRTPQVAAATLATCLALVAGSAYADTPSPRSSAATPSAAPSASAGGADPSPTSSGSNEPGTSASPSSASPSTASPSTASPSSAPALTPTPVPTTTPTSTLEPTPSQSASEADRLQVEAQGEDPISLTLAITAGGTPKAGTFYEDIGYFAIRGTVTGRPKGTKVGIYWYHSASKRWRRSGVVATTAKGGYAFNQPVGYAGSFAFRATLGGAPGQSEVVSSPSVTVKVLNASVTQRALVASVNALKSPTVSGFVTPARRGIKIVIQVRSAKGRFGTVATATTGASGAYRAPLTYGYGQLGTQTVRSAYRSANRPRWEISRSGRVKRVRVLDAVITKTTSADVARTYRRGCPVGPSKLRTVRMNYYGFDRRMHRGVMIVRSTMTGRVTRSFSAAMHAGYPIAKMRNPNVYGGNDPRQMAADNTSAFNCRKVVGNPYAMSPHSYGTAIDVNTVKNPYRDRNGKWWPAAGKRYIDRTPLRRGMLGKSSTLTTRLQREGYFWGGRWSPGRDYQHFQH